MSNTIEFDKGLVFGYLMNIMSGNYNDQITPGSILASFRKSCSLDLNTIAAEMGLEACDLEIKEKQGKGFTSKEVQKYIQVVTDHIIPLPAKSLVIEGGRQLSGEVSVNTSKNGAMGLLCASLLNKGKTILHGIPRIEEVHRMLEVFESIGVDYRWMDGSGNSLQIVPPQEFDLKSINYASASRTRSIIMLIGALISSNSDFSLPMPSGCNLGTRTVTPHINGLERLGVGIESEHTDNLYFHVRAHALKPNIILMREKGDTATENLIIAAACIPGKTIIRGASTNYMVMEVIQFLQGLGVTIEQEGGDQLIVYGRDSIEQDGYEYYNSEDPIESMTLLTAAVVTKSHLLVKKCPRKYIEFELAWLGDMGLEYNVSGEYFSKNGQTVLVDVEVFPSSLKAVDLVIKPSTYPGINPDNAPFFVLICTQAEGESQYNDWMFNGRNKMFVEDLNKLGADITMIGEHTLKIKGVTPLRGSITTSPKALRPTVIIMLAMLSAQGKSTLVDTYQVYRGYQDLPKRLNTLGAEIEDRPHS